MNAHGAFLPSSDPSMQSPDPSGYMRGALVFLYALLDNAPLGVSLHHVLPALDAGDIIEVKQVPVNRSDKLPQIIRSVCRVTADVWASSLLLWDGKTHCGVEQKPEMLLENNRECRRAPKTLELLDDLARECEKVLESGDYKWVVDGGERVV
ncbi:hypothetical protein TL16_g12994 [Triparma laevis f. inornata]|uniref:Formyl transferase N-terminal domain-containing protein n=2 Tax=Triparma laevis TaxID=1534972 RepID=A0A9W7ARN9_9STRA|nr:hypothetical protein TrLO_g13612 [Triparma laevis f. longispina]GMH94757.1 hypothetical protein TL16_g12994 [Triparma laevis f. inornata]